MMTTATQETLYDKLRGAYINRNGIEREITEVVFNDLDFGQIDIHHTTFKNCDFSKANLKGVILSNVTFKNCYFGSAKFMGSSIHTCQFYQCSLWGANLRGSWIRNTKFENCNFFGTDFTKCTFEFPNFINNITDETTKNFSLNCPEEGSYIGWKTASGFLVKLLIPEDAKRSSATTRKCRASKAVVLDIFNKHLERVNIDKVPSNWNNNFYYEIGKTVEVPDFDKNRWRECAPGIHHFITKEEALNYDN